MRIAINGVGMVGPTPAYVSHAVPGQRSLADFLVGRDLRDDVGSPDDGFSPTKPSRRA